MAKDIIIDGTQYTNLQTTYSEKNNIDNVKGKEYRILGTEIIDFNIQQDSYIDSSGVVEIHYADHPDGTTISTPTFTGINSVEFPYDNLRLSFDTLEARLLWGANVYARKEGLVLSGSFIATTESAIQDINSIAVTCQIDYNTYHRTIDTANPNDLLINQSNLRSNSKQNPVFEMIRTMEYLQNKTENEGETTINTQTTESALDTQYITSIAGLSPLGAIDQSIDLSSSLGQFKVSTTTPLSKLDTKVSVLASTENETRVRVDYQVTIWVADTSGVSYEWLVAKEYVYNYELLTANKLTFSVKANGISTESSDFSYGDGEYKEYQLDDNELMQYSKDQIVETKQSYKTSEKMLDQTQINRMIVSFDLLDCDKIVPVNIVNNEQTSETIGYYRYLTTGDLIKLRDQNGDFIGQYYDDSGNLVIPYFEIISYHGRWDGTFHVEIVCKQKF